VSPLMRADDHQHVAFSQEIEHGAQFLAVRDAGDL
jgi:hypothetical protein